MKYSLSYLRGASVHDKDPQVMESVRWMEMEKQMHKPNADDYCHVINKEGSTATV